MKKNRIKKSIILLIVLSVFMILTSCATTYHSGASRIDQDPERTTSFKAVGPNGYPIGP